MARKRERRKWPRVLFWDLETAGVNAFSADQGYIVCFGYKWLGDKDTKCLTVLDFPGKNCQDDTKLLSAALEIMEDADLLVAHYGDRFDRKFFEARLLRAGLKPIPGTRQVDTCLLARAKLKLSSNRLANLASFLGVETQKMAKGNGWPSWWMGALRGDKKSILAMAKYCRVDVQCLSEIYLRIRHLIPEKYLINMSIGQNRYMCGACGANVQYRGFYFSARKMYRRFQCRACGKWGRETRAMDKAL